MNMLRLYTHIAWVTGRPLDVLEVNCHWMCTSLPIPNDPRGWDWKTTLACARCVNYAYGDQPKTPERWLSCFAYTTEWEASRPACFDPIFQQDVSEGSPFPKILFLNEVHGMASVQLVWLLLLCELLTRAQFLPSCTSAWPVSSC